MKLTMIASSTMGLESQTARELRDLGLDAHNAADQPGRTYFTGDFSDLVRANLHLRTAGRVLIHLATFPLESDFSVLFDAVDAVAWEDWMPRHASILVEARSVQSSITSLPALQRVVKRGIVNRLSKAYHLSRLPEDGPKFTVEISVYKNQAVLTLDSTGRGLHRRGYRLLNGAAPLRETLAAALVELSVWNPARPLVDPFCGSGTILIEAALLGRRIAPGLKRRFASEDWPILENRLWTESRREAESQILPSLPERICGYDIDPEAIRLAQFHAQRAGVGGDIDFRVQDFRDLRDDRRYGCVICNPPYGERIGGGESLRDLYESMPSVLSYLPTWSHYIFTAWNDLEKVFGQQSTRRRKLYNSRLECTYFQFLGPKPPKTSSAADNPVLSYESPVPSPSVPDSAPSAPITPVFGGLDPSVDRQLFDFRRRLERLAHHLRRYPKRGIECYRLYDRDIPEIPLAIDIYNGDYLHIAEYDRPNDRSPSQHRTWLEAMTAAAAETLSIPADHVFLKRRQRQRGISQYEKQGEKRVMIDAREGGLLFRCNLTDYLDTGLFLDHRKTREMVRGESAGKRFLNLFCYTGAFTCYAASGGAASTTSVDLSSTYLDWARENMEFNGFRDRSRGGGGDHQYFRSDVISFLRETPEAGFSGFPGYDLCVCDPPTYSNSKATEEDWDVQRNHAELLTLLAKRMATGGTVYFSTNFRRFKLDEEAIQEYYAYREITNQTIPEEFRNKRIHRCWKLKLR